MASQPPPESVIFGQFTGLKNTVTPERLAQDELARATNVDIDDAGQASRRRGYTLKDGGDWHSVVGVDEIGYGVRNGALTLIRPDLSLVDLGVQIGQAPACYTEVGGDIYFSSADADGVISGETVNPWGQDDQGTWLSPVYSPTAYLGEVGGKLLGDPPKATSLAAYKGRIYLAVDNLLWATELFAFHFVDRTKNFFQFEDAITMISPAGDGLWVGTTGGLYFMKGTLEAFRPLEQFTLTKVSDDNVLPGSLVYAPIERIHPQALTSPVPAGTGCMFMTTGGVIAAFDGGSCYNLTHNKFLFPVGTSAASLFRHDQGATSYVATVDSGGTPAAAARMGDYIEAEIRRFGG